MRLGIDVDGKRLNCRAVAVIIENGRVLLHRTHSDDFWALPGGGIEFGETAAATVVRELAEELGAVFQVERLLWVVENFYTYGLPTHEIGFYFLVRAEAGWPGLEQQTFCTEEDGVEVIFAWCDLAEVATTRLYPSFLRAALCDLPAAPMMIAHTDEEDTATL